MVGFRLPHRRLDLEPMEEQGPFRKTGRTMRQPQKLGQSHMLRKRHSNHDMPVV